MADTKLVDLNHLIADGTVTYKGLPAPAIRVTLDAMLARRAMRARDLARIVGLSETQLSLFRSGKVKGIRFETLARLCAALECRPGDLLDHEAAPPVTSPPADA